MLAFVLMMFISSPMFAQDTPVPSSQSDNTEQVEQLEAEPFAEEIEKLTQSFPEDEGLVKALTKTLKKEKSTAPITNNAIVFGILMVMLGPVSYTHLTLPTIYSV